MKQIWIFFLFLIVVYSLDIENYRWKWISGTNISGDQGYFGTKGTFHPSHIPPSRFDHSMTVDRNGDVWIFGGENELIVLNDLWKFDVNLFQWAWMGGSSNIYAFDSGYHGEKGVVTPNARPSGRRGAGIACDSENNIWIYGGETSNYLTSNELWKFDGSDWIWMDGETETNFTSLTSPPQVSFSSFVVDSNNSFWLWGGRSYIGVINDLWKYSNGEWTFVSGSLTPAHKGFADQKGVYSSSLLPASRRRFAYWMDNQDNLWIFGGDKISQRFNDLWKYSTKTNEWIWLSGGNATNVEVEPPNYGIKYVSSPSNVPPARTHLSAQAVDSKGNLWLTGGSNGPPFDDIWIYNGENWVWVGGNQGPRTPNEIVYKDQPNYSQPFPRDNLPIVMLPYLDSLILFGGSDYYGSSSSILNEMWVFTTDESFFPNSSSITTIPFILLFFSIILLS